MTGLCMHKQKIMLPGHSRVRGFTLVEMLISLVLSAIIFVSAYQVISNLIQYQVRYGEKSEKQMDLLIVRNLINQILNKGLHQSDLYFRISKTPFFEGEHASLRVISRAFSDHFDVPGYRLYRLYVSNNELMVSYNRYDKDAINEESKIQSSGIRIEQISFEYYLKGEWRKVWKDDKAIPRLVKIKVMLPDKNIFEWVSRTGQA